MTGINPETEVDEVVAEVVVILTAQTLDPDHGLVAGAVVGAVAVIRKNN